MWDGEEGSSVGPARQQNPSSLSNMHRPQHLPVSGPRPLKGWHSGSPVKSHDTHFTLQAAHNAGHSALCLEAVSGPREGPPGPFLGHPTGAKVLSAEGSAAAMDPTAAANPTAAADPSAAEEPAAAVGLGASRPAALPRSSPKRKAGEEGSWGAAGQHRLSRFSLTKHGLQPLPVSDPGQPNTNMP